MSYVIWPAVLWESHCIYLRTAFAIWWKCHVSAKNNPAASNYVSSLPTVKSRTYFCSSLSASPCFSIVHHHIYPLLYCAVACFTLCYEKISSASLYFLCLMKCDVMKILNKLGTMTNPWLTLLVNAPGLIIPFSDLSVASWFSVSSPFTTQLCTSSYVPHWLNPIGNLADVLPYVW